MDSILSRSMTYRRPWWKSVLLNARALVCGVLIAVLLVTAYTWAEAVLEGGFFGLSPSETARIAALFAGVVALQLLMVCVPVWLLLARLHLSNWASAALLGFIAPLAYWIITSEGEILDLVRSGLPYALSGAVAGLVVWWARPRAIPPPLART